MISLTGFLLTLQPSETVAEKPNNQNETSAKTEINLWDRLWYRDDQLAFELLEGGDAETAAQLFQDEKWKSIANYRNREWGPALNGFANDLSADGFYNQANSLAQLGSLNEAIEKYDRALELNPKDDDAQFNRDLIKELLQKQQEQQKKKKKTMRDNSPSHPIKVIKTTASKQMTLPQTRPTKRINSNKPKAPIPRKRIKANPTEN